MTEKQIAEDRAAAAQQLKELIMLLTETECRELTHLVTQICKKK